MFENSIVLFTYLINPPNVFLQDYYHPQDDSPPIFREDL